MSTIAMPTRNEALSRGPRFWYADHVLNRDDCWCQEDVPDSKCDKGEALFRLQAVEVMRAALGCAGCGDPECGGAKRRRRSR